MNNELFLESLGECMCQSCLLGPKSGLKLYKFIIGGFVY